MPSKRKADQAGEALRAFMRDPALDATHEPTRRAVATALDWINDHRGPLDQVMYAMREIMEARDLPQPGGRLKRFQAVVRKLQRYETMRLSQIEDLGGCRITFPTQEEADSVLELIMDAAPKARLDDYVGNPKPGGYRSKHVVVGSRRRIEIQIRTDRQNLWADEVESAADRLDLPLKYAEGPPDLVRYFELAAEVLAAEDQGKEPKEDVRRELAEHRELVRPYFSPSP